jgi:probable rRNA maturation factor
MRILNLQHRGIDRTTDVLSFPQQSAEALKSRRTERDLRTSKLQPSEHRLILGDIVINLPKAKRQANEHGLAFSEELRKLIIHGLLHLTGYDHGRSEYLRKKMESKEQELLEGLRYY